MCGVLTAGLALSVVICCIDVEEMSDSLVSQLTAGSNDSSAAGDADGQRTGNITLSLTEYSSLTSRLAAAEETARHLAEQLQHSLNDVEKMRLLLTFSLVYTVNIHFYVI